MRDALTWVAARWYVCLALAAAVYLGFAAFSIDKPLTLDQAEPNADNAAVLADLGPGAFGDREVAHPQLHEHLLALTYQLLGKSSTSARILNLLCMVVVLLLIVRLSRELFPGPDGLAIGSIAVLLYACNPFVLQHSLIVDRDTTIHPIAILLFLWLFIRQDHAFTRSAILKLGAMLALCAWAKEVSPAFLLTPMFLYLWWRLDLRQALMVTLAVAAVGGVLFVATWLAWCWWAGVAPLSFIEASIINRALNPEFHKDRSPVAALRSLLGRTTPWVTPGLMILAALAAGRRLIELRRERYAARPIDLLWLFVLLFWGVTNLYMSSISRWQFPLYAVAVIPLAEFLLVKLRDVGLWTVAGALAAGLLVGLVAGVALDDPLLREGDQSFLRSAIWYFGLWFAAPLLACWLLVRMLRTGLARRTQLLLTTLSLLAAISLAMNIKQTADYTTAPSWGRDYGERGFDQTLAYLDAHVGESVPVIRKDLAFYLMMGAHGRDMEWVYNSIFRGDLSDPAALRRVQEVLARPEVRYVVLDVFSTSDRAKPWDVAAYLGADFELAADFGGFRVYSKTSDG